MGNNEGWPQSNGLLLNGLLPNVAERVTQKLDSERWSEAEERTAELIACIQPNQPSEERRNAVANYVQQLIMKCFSCQVFTFGSVPLKTYLPDGDIDLTAFSKNQNLKDTWANDVRDILENEEKRENAEFRVKEVQYIQAEVKIIKCLVENIVVDISFNQLGGLCTLCFLEEVDQLINQNHLFKRSIILIKAWCYYESRILGAHHGLISTYALETLVLYIFHVFNNSFSGPLEVLYRFLEFFSNFDWENFCVSLWGPVPINQLPDMRAVPPRKDSGDLLLSKPFLDACGAIYAVCPGVQENQGQPFVSKHFNVVDPLRTNNNLGRSVSKGNFFRIRSAFAFGAKKLARLLECPKEDLIDEVNQFFMNTWDRHGSRHRPDAPSPDLGLLRPPNMESKDDSSTCRNQLATKKKGASDGLVQISPVSLSDGASNIHNALSENVPKTSNASGVHHISNQKNYGNQLASAQKTHKFLKTCYSLDNQEAQSTHQFTRTRSSPELTKTSSESLTKGWQINKAVDTGKNHQVNARTECNTRRKNLPSGTLTAYQVLHASSDDPSLFRHSPSPQGSRTSSASNLPDGFNRYTQDNDSEVSQDLLQEQQDFINMMASSSAHGFPGPLSLPTSHIPVPPILGYTQRNLGGMMPRSLSLVDPVWGSGVQLPPGLVSSPLSHYLSGLHLASTPEQMGSSNESSDLTESNEANNDASLWPENDHVSSGSLKSASSSQLDGSSGNSVRGQSQKLPQRRSNDVYASDKSSNMRAFTINELNLSKLPKPSREKKGRKAISGGLPSTPENSKTGWQHETDVSAVVDEADDKDWHMKSRHGGSVSAIHPPFPVGYEGGSSGSDPMFPGPMVVGSGSRQITFYPTGPPVPFVTMLPLYNFSQDAGNSGGSPRQFDRDDSFVENGHTSLSEKSITTSNFDTGESQESEVFRNPSPMDLPAMEPRDDLHMDILHSDFTSHWQNLQYGRICQSPHNHPPIIYSPQFIVPPVYLQGHFPWDGPGRPSAAGNMGLFTQFMGYGPRILPVSPLQPGPSRTAGVHQHYGEELPRYRGGTGTYLPNPKPVSFRDRQSANNHSHRGGNSYDRNGHGDTDRGWNVNSRPRGSGRSHNKYDVRGQSDKLTSRSDHPGAPDTRADLMWDSYRHEAFNSFPLQSGPFTSANPIQSARSVAYSKYPLQAVNPNAVGSSLSATGPGVPSVVMLYPYEHNIGYGHSQDQLEFGSLGAVHLGNVNGPTGIGDGGLTPALYDQRHSVFKGGSPARSSPDRPSSPQLRRGI